MANYRVSTLQRERVLLNLCMCLESSHLPIHIGSNLTNSFHQVNRSLKRLEMLGLHCDFLRALEYSMYVLRCSGVCTGDHNHECHL